MIKNVQSINGTWHIALYNYENSFCHHIATLQRLHSSPTLNRLLRNTTLPDDDYIRMIIEPVRIYASYVGSIGGGASLGISGGDNSLLSSPTEEMIYNQMKDYYTTFVNDYVSSVGRNGYSPMYVLIYLFVPVVWTLFPDDFEAIISELHIDKINFLNVEATVKDIITGPSAFLQERFVEHQYELYTKMIEVLPTEFHPKHFVSTVMEVFPNREHKGGHAITLLRGMDENFYVIDDQNSISKLEDYYMLRESRLYSITLRDIDEITVANINAILHAKCAISDDQAIGKRVSRYELNFEHKFVTAPEASVMKVNDRYWIGMIVGLLIGVVVGLIVSLIVSSMFVKHDDSQTST